MLVGKYNINYKVGNTLQDSIEYNNIHGTFSMSHRIFILKGDLIWQPRQAWLDSTGVEMNIFTN